MLKIGQASDGHTVLNVTRQELADMIGSTVETTIRVTSKWQQAGLISSGRQQLRLIDLTALSKIARGES